jgi:hypothetical protein
MKKLHWTLIVIVILIVAFTMIFRPGGEDSWIKDEKGVWIKHGVPSKTPDYVLEQQEAINCALEKIDNFTDEINSQCLGVCGDYAVDIVHIPRSSEDNLVENQCEAYRNGEVSHFIELDKDGNIVRIV